MNHLYCVAIIRLCITNFLVCKILSSQNRCHVEGHCTLMSESLSSSVLWATEGKSPGSFWLLIMQEVV